MYEFPSKIFPISFQLFNEILKSLKYEFIVKSRH